MNGVIVARLAHGQRWRSRAGRPLAQSRCRGNTYTAARHELAERQNICALDPGLKRFLALTGSAHALLVEMESLYLAQLS
jgi:hypothetical protein